MKKNNWRNHALEELDKAGENLKQFDTGCGNLVFKITTDEKKNTMAVFCGFSKSFKDRPQHELAAAVNVSTGFSTCKDGDTFSLKIGMENAIRDCRQQIKSVVLGIAKKRVRQLEAICNGGKKNSRLKGYFRENGNTNLSELEESLLDDLGGVISMFLARAYPGNYLIGWENKMPAAAYMAWHEQRSVPMGNTALSPELARKMILLAKACRFWPRKAVIETCGAKRFLPHMFEPKLEAALKKQLSEIRNQVLEDAKKAVDAQNKREADKEESEAKEKVMESVKH